MAEVKSLATFRKLFRDFQTDKFAKISVSHPTTQPASGFLRKEDNNNAASKTKIFRKNDSEPPLKFGTLAKCIIKIAKLSDLNNNINLHVLTRSKTQYT